MFDEIASFSNLRRAYRLARKAGRTSRGALAFDYGLERNLHGLQREMLTGRYRPGPYRSFYVTEPKRRLVSATPFSDRVVHHALVSVLEPRFERRFIKDYYACRKRKGTHRAVTRTHGWVRRYRYCLTADVVRFSPSVDHEVLMGTVARVVSCKDTLQLMRVILDGGKDVLRSEFSGTLFPGDDLTALLRPADREPHQPVPVQRAFQGEAARARLCPLCG